MAAARFILIAGSPTPDFDFLNQALPKYANGSRIIAIDSGLHICSALGLPVSWIIGDFDSVDPTVLEQYPSDAYMQYSPEKDQSDTEIALNFALQQNPTEILLFNAEGGRPDHALFNFLLLTKARGIIRQISRFGAVWAMTPNTINMIHAPPETLFSLIPLTECVGVSIKGAKYPLINRTLERSTLTLSNAVLDKTVIFFTSGVLLCFLEAY